MKYEILLSDQAAAEAEKTYAYIAGDSVTRATRWYNRLLERIMSLSEFPMRCAVAPETETTGIPTRHFIYGNYRIIFHVGEKTVEILHVRHAARRPVDDN